MKKLSLILLLSGFAFFLYSCSSSIPRTDKVHQEWAEKHWENIHLSAARELYATNCSGCHTLHAPEEHTRDEWISLFASMSRKAHLTPRDSISVIAYLQTYSNDNHLILQ